jgi:hypothetical protein
VNRQRLTFPGQKEIPYPGKTARTQKQRNLRIYHRPSGGGFSLSKPPLQAIAVETPTTTDLAAWNPPFFNQTVDTLHMQPQVSCSLFGCQDLGAKPCHDLTLSSGHTPFVREGLSGDVSSDTFLMLAKVKPSREIIPFYSLLFLILLIFL